MSVVRALVQLSLLAACGATSFVSVQAYMVAKEEIRSENGSQVPDVSKLSDNGDPTKDMSPIIPTAKYAVSALDMPGKKAALAVPAKKVAAAAPMKPAKIARLKKAPMQLASFNQEEQPRAYGYASEPAPPRAAGIFGLFR
jgi:hypothetical protein